MTIIRPSSLTTFADCQRRWAAHNLGAELRASGYTIAASKNGIGAVVGSGVHAGAAHLLQHKINHGELGNSREAVDVSIAELRERMFEGEVVFDEATPSPNNAEAQAQRLTLTFATRLAPALNPIIVERRLVADLGQGFTLSGQSDLITAQEDGIDDLKTGRLYRRHMPQMGAYSLLARTPRPEFPEGISVTRLRTHFLQRTSLSKPQPDPVSEGYSVQTSEQAATSTINGIKAAVEQFRLRTRIQKAPPEHAFLANPGSMMCNPNFCRAWGTAFCKEHKGADL